jgi:hypothetical protein
LIELREKATTITGAILAKWTIFDSTKNYCEVLDALYFAFRKLSNIMYNDLKGCYLKK